MRPLKQVTVLMIAALLLAGSARAEAAADADADGIPDGAEALLGTDPLVADTDGDGVNDLADTDPVFAPDPLDASGKPAMFAIKEALVENNYDYAHKKDAPDHLELLIANAGPADLTGFSVHVAITDSASGRTEGTFRRLDGLGVPAGGEARIHFDDGTQPGHFRANPNSVYVTSDAAKVFTVTVRADGFAPVTTAVSKDKGGAEKAD